MDQDVGSRGTGGKHCQSFGSPHLTCGMSAVDGARESGTSVVLLDGQDGKTRHEVRSTVPCVVRRRHIFTKKAELRCLPSLQRHICSESRLLRESTPTGTRILRMFWRQPRQVAKIQECLFTP